MINIDFTKFLYDHVWFGFYLDYPKIGYFGLIDRKKLKWTYPTGSDWADRLYPMRRYGEPFPTWWFILWRIPLVKDDDD